MKEWLFERQGSDFTATEACRSPWHPGILHGGAVSALFGLLAEEYLQQHPAFVLNRLSMNLFKPVPLATLNTRIEVVRDGGRLKLVRFYLSCQGKPVADAEALLQKTRALELPAWAPASHPVPAQPDTLSEFTIQDLLEEQGVDIPHGFHSRVRVRAVTPWNEEGATTAWLDVPLEILPGQPLTPLTRVCMLSDLGNGSGQLKLGEALGTINADIVLTLSRYPNSEWICFDSHAMFQPNGVGITHTRLFDTEGEIGHVLQAVQPNGDYQG